MTMTTAEKTRETRLRRMAERQGLKLEKSRRRDHHAWDYGMFMILSAENNGVVAGTVAGRPGFTIDDVEEYLTGETT